MPKKRETVDLNGIVYDIIKKKSVSANCEIFVVKKGKEYILKYFHSKHQFWTEYKFLHNIEMTNFICPHISDGAILGPEKVILYSLMPEYYMTLHDFVLESIKKSGRGPTFNFIDSVSLQLFKALDYLHSRDFIHGDIKPENIMFQTSDKNEIVLIDFGQTQNSKGPLDRNIGTNPYRAPELWLKKLEITPAIDIWSAMLTIYFTMTGDDLLDLNGESRIIPEMYDILMQKNSDSLRSNCTLDPIYSDDNVYQIGTVINTLKVLHILFHIIGPPSPAFYGTEIIKEFYDKEGCPIFYGTKESSILPRHLIDIYGIDAGMSEKIRSYLSLGLAYLPGDRKSAKDIITRTII